MVEQGARIRCERGGGERGCKSEEQEKGKIVVCERRECEWDMRVGCEIGMRVWCESVVQEWEWVERVQCEK